MQPLKEVIAALRREIEEGLDLNRSTTGQTTLQAERVSVSLQFSIADSTGPKTVVFGVEAGQKEKLSQGTAAHHSLTVEWRINQGKHSHPVGNNGHNGHATKLEPIETQLQGAEANSAREELALIFGEAGFDSSARATVFREVLSNLSLDQIPALTSALSGLSTPPPKSPVIKAIARLDRVLKSGPSGVSQGRPIVARLLQRCAVPSLIQLVADVWKSQEDWIA